MISDPLWCGPQQNNRSMETKTKNNFSIIAASDFFRGAI